MAKERFRETADYTISLEPDGYYVRFYCAVSGALLCAVGPVREGPQGAALETAWQTEGRSHFNQCHRCGRWVSDVMYNADALECVECAPWKLPLYFCPECGAGIPAPDAASVYRERKNPGSTIKGSAGSAWNSMDLGRTL